MTGCRQFRRSIRLGGLAFVMWLLCVAGAPAWSSAPVSFNDAVRPILSDRCFACHGPNASSREAELRLDQRASATKDRGGYRVVVPGDATKSELLKRIASTDPDEVMPPPGEGKPLTAAEIDTLRRWIDEGAAYEKHWAYRPLKRPPVPVVTSGERRNPIDAFIDRKLRQAGIEANPTADPRTLVRRLSFDLTGLPAPADLVERFKRNPTDEAYLALVDHFLSSPHYGERMAIYWLDLVRYADSLGYHGDQVRSVSPYRDYVIRSFNENKPFDQFTIEQLAGDLLPDATLWQKVASTYNRLNRASAEGGVQPKEYLAKYAADRVRTTGAVWLGSTFLCAECHDHKFDPFTMRDFYSFAAFFADIREQGIVPGAKHLAVLPVPTPEQTKELNDLRKRLDEATAKYSRTSDATRKSREQWVATLRRQEEQWHVLRPVDVMSKEGTRLQVQSDGSVLATGPSPDNDVYTVEFQVDVESIAALRLELLPDRSLPASGPGRAGNGNVVLQRLDASIGGRPISWVRAVADHSQQGFEAASIAKKGGRGWAILPQVGKRHELLLIPKETISVLVSEEEPTRSRLTVRLIQRHGARHTIGHFRISVAETLSQGYGEYIASAEVRAAVETESSKRSPDQEKILDDAFRAWAPEFRELREQRRQIEAAIKEVERSIVTTLATSSTKPRTIRILPRGNWMDDSGDVVLPAVPAFLPPPTEEGNGRLTRLDLARWLTSRDNPLVARTFVNRLWMLLFGEGICRSVDDLGSQGEVPTHPALLDWLAAEFIESGWDVKHMVRLIVTSDAYRRSSQATAVLRERDPYNRLLARQGRWRLDAEMVRDQALAASGLLVQTIGGVSAKPYQPAGYWAQLNFPKRVYKHDTDDRQYRRGVYVHWQRTFLHPSLLAFDAPVREECTARRARSNTPLQALVLLNDPTYVEAARVLAERVMLDGGRTFNDRLQSVWRRVLARKPSSHETARLRSYWQENLAAYREAPKEAEKLTSIGLTPRSKECDVIELAAWTAVCRVALNLHETITRY